MFPVVAQSESLTRSEYIEKYKPLAIRNMREHRIPASITLAQACLESNNGNSELAKRSNNHFGIKCHSTWKGKRTYHDDDKRKECFRVYPDVYGSYADHSEFLQRSRYARCFELEITDYKGWARELKKAGYATNPKYPDLLIRIIEENKLYLIDQEALGQLAEQPNPEQPKQPDSKPAESSASGSAEIDIYNNVRVQRSANNIKYVEAESGDGPERIAQRLNMGAWQIRKYNNVDKDHVFKPGEVVYLQPKRAQAASTEFHEVQRGETIWDISQLYGIR
ncbi:MAG: LysM peptidoglycan-binding domain-containing protein, partial [Leptolyngbya sp. SIO3F4]|nr:LysM peptidoglycan-binding domain-containing protein [Leptolyngbya sp. SIO3F4]